MAQKADRGERREEIVEEAEEAAVSEEENREASATAAITAAADTQATAGTSAEAEAARASIEDMRDTHRVVRRMAAREAGQRTCAISAVRQDTTRAGARSAKTIENNLKPLSNSFIIC